MLLIRFLFMFIYSTVHFWKNSGNPNENLVDTNIRNPNYDSPLILMLLFFILQVSLYGVTSLR